jgi:hypothetical protein
VTGGWRQLYNEELHNLCSPNTNLAVKSCGITCAGHVARIANVIDTSYNILVGKFEGEIPLEKHNSKWDDNIKMDLK